MSISKRCIAVLLFLMAGAAWAEGDGPSLFSLGYYQFYGTPLQPQSVAQTTQDGLGFEVLGEFNPSYFFSVGLDYEKVTFYSASNFTLSAFGLESRVFLNPNGKSSFAPYVYAGAGLGLEAGSGNQVKIGLGNRVNLFNPIFLDISVGSNWFDTGFQYVNFRGGLSLSFDFPKGQGGSAPEPTKAAPSATSTPTYENLSFEKSVTPTVTPTQTDMPTTPTETPNTKSPSDPPLTKGEVEDKGDLASSTQVPAGSLMKKYYQLGVKAYGAKDYPTAIENLKKALMEEEKIPYYYYAEANATLGVIYHFYSKVKDHNALALKYYKRALKIDPDTKSAKKFIKMLEPKPEPKKKGKAKAKPKAKPAKKPAPKPTLEGEIDY